MGKLDDCEDSPLLSKKEAPVPPPLPGPIATSHIKKGLMMHGSNLGGYSCVSTAVMDRWDRLFDEAYRADVIINTGNGGSAYAHANILGIASPVMKGMLKQAKNHGRRRTISIHGVPHDAVRVFIRFLYSSRYNKEDMEEFVLHLLVLSHVFVVPQLKQICVWQLEQGFLTTENVIDIFQLALLCDAPRLSLICHRMILRNFQEISATEGWKVMKKSHPVLEKEILETVIDEDNVSTLFLFPDTACSATKFKAPKVNLNLMYFQRQKEKIRKSSERKIYLQLYEAMEALVHICRDGCRTIGPHDKKFAENQETCNYSACKGLELLVRHFASCKLRVPSGCIHCKRMWQLLELHSRLCADSDICRVPLCRNFKERIRKQSKKDEVRWRMLVKNILRTRNIGGSPFFSSFSFIYC